jgi:hypothetical protein
MFVQLTARRRFVLGTGSITPGPLLSMTSILNNEGFIQSAPTASAVSLGERVACRNVFGTTSASAAASPGAGARQLISHQLG